MTLILVTLQLLLIVLSPENSQFTWSSICFLSPNNYKQIRNRSNTPFKIPNLTQGRFCRYKKSPQTDKLSKKREKKNMKQEVEQASPFSAFYASGKTPAHTLSLSLIKHQHVNHRERESEIKIQNSKSPTLERESQGIVTSLGRGNNTRERERRLNWIGFGIFSIACLLHARGQVL